MPSYFPNLVLYIGTWIHNLDITEKNFTLMPLSEHCHQFTLVPKITCVQILGAKSPWIAFILGLIMAILGSQLHLDLAKTQTIWAEL